MSRGTRSHSEGALLAREKQKQKEGKVKVGELHSPPAQLEFILYDFRGWMVSFCTVSISRASSS
jgi:hypothetical protein